MSETMLERVAKALEPKCRSFGRGDMPMAVAREFARAAIEAMRIPTDEMCEAIGPELQRQGIAMDECSPPLYPGPIFTVMIDAALASTPEMEDNAPSP